MMRIVCMSAYVNVAEQASKLIIITMICDEYEKLNGEKGKQEKQQSVRSVPERILNFILWTCSECKKHYYEF